MDKVLEVKEVARSNSQVIYQITHQDEKALPRSEFEDDELEVYSISYPQYEDARLYLRGCEEENDDNFIILKLKEEKRFLKIVKKLNKKYKKRWRAEINNIYYSFSIDGEINRYTENGHGFDSDTHAFGNYFKTIEEAEEKRDKIKKILLEG